MRLLVAGAGDLGQRVARLAARAGHQVTAVRRTATDPEGVRCLSADLCQPQGWLPQLAACDSLLWCVSPDARDEAAYRRIYLDAAVEFLRVAAALDWHWRRVVFVSSTAVYAEAAWPQDESSPCAPAEFNGEVLLAAEQAIARLCPGFAVAARLGGIYGPGRDWLLRRVRAGTPVQAFPPRFSNRIHIDDAARALLMLLEHPRPPAVCNVVDPSPSAEHEVLDWLAAQLGVAEVPKVSGGGTGKQIQPQVLAGLGFQWDYPDYRSGYTTLLGACRGPAG